LARNQLFSPADQENQQLHRLFLELYPSSVAAKFVAPEVELNFGSCTSGGKHRLSVSEIIL
jgi:hypothetical protein